MIKTLKEHVEQDAIGLGYGLTKSGYCTIDTTEDAQYFGVWLNIEELKIVSYCEGDLIVNIGENKEEFLIHLKKVIKFYQDRKEFLGIDPGLNEKKRDSLINFGLANLIH